MKTIKILFAALIISTGVNAQTKDAAQTETVQKKTPEERAKFQTEKMTTELNLSDDQISRVYEINLGIDKKNEGLKEVKMTEEDRKKSIAQNNEARKAMLKEVLTADQFTKLEQKQMEMKSVKKIAPPREPKKPESQPSKENSNN